jgi:hypothetical protein
MFLGAGGREYTVIGVPGGVLLFMSGRSREDRFRTSCAPRPNDSTPLPHTQTPQLASGEDVRSGVHTARL